MPAIQRLIIDTDAGIDDAVALALALRSPEVSVCAITTTYGNNTVRAATRNVRAVLARAGVSRLPVLPGAATPMHGRPVAPRSMHGSSGLGNAPVSPADHVVPDATVLGRAIMSVPGPVTVVTIGPLTNLAWALRSFPDGVRQRVRRHITLGTMIRRPANEIGDAADDFNTSVDLDATQTVAKSGLPSLTIPVALARGIVLSQSDVGALAACPIPLASWLASALEYSVEHHRLHRRVSGCSLPDVAAIAAVISPDVITVRTVDAEIGLDAVHGDDHTDRRPTGRDLEMAMAIEHRRIRDLLIRVFGSVWYSRKEGAL